MKNALAFMLIAAVALIALPSEASIKPRIAVPRLDFALPIVGEGMADLLSRELAKSGRFETIGRSELERLISEDDLLKSAYFEPDATISAAKKLGLDFVLFAKLSAFGENDIETGKGDWVDRLGLNEFQPPEHVAYVKLDFRLLAIETGEIIAAGNAAGEKSGKGISLGVDTPSEMARLDLASDYFKRAMIGKAAYKAAGALLLKLYGEFPLYGTVLSRSGNIIVADINIDAGLPIGSIVKVLMMTPIADSKGSVVWEYYQEVGTARVLEYQGQNCLAEIITGSSEIKPGMRVQPAEQPRYLPAELARSNDKEVGGWQA
jgi:curli biogenesis system outer membrane secretion channel CsgG